MKYQINTGDILLKFSSFLSLVLSLIFMLLVNNLQLGTLTVMGSLFFYYYVPQTNKAGIKTVVMTSIVGVVSFVIMSICSLVPWLIPLMLSLLCSLFFFYNKMWRLVGPGPFLLVMISCIAGLHRFVNIQSTLLSVSFLIAGSLISISLAFLNDFILDKIGYSKLKDNTAPFTLSVGQIPSDILFKTFFYGVLIFLSYYIGENLKLFNYYWAVISCASILQSESMSHAFKRHQHYILGTVVGCVISYILLSVHLTFPYVILLLILFNSLIYWKMKTNFLIGHFFTTPMAILVIKLNLPSLSHQAILARFLDIIIGTTIAITSIYLFNYLKKKCIAIDEPKKEA